MRVFILGAGFSKPAGMPLANELTDALIARATMNGEVTDMQGWLDSLKKRLRFLQRDDTARINVEELFHYAQFEIEVWRLKHHLAPVGRNDGQTFWKEAESIETWLSYLLHALVDEIWAKQQAADLDPISRWARTLRPDDIVVTFNYDTLIEDALTACKLPWTHGMPRETNTGICVLKMHGSIDWQLMERDTFNGQLATLLFRKENSNLCNSNREPDGIEDAVDLIRVHRAKLGGVVSNRDFNVRYFGIAGLGTYKELHQVPGLGVVWSKAAQALAKADQIIVVGFAMSPFDAMVRLMLVDVMMNRTGKKKNQAPQTFLISPDAEQLKPNFDYVFSNVLAISKRHQHFDWRKLDEQRLFSPKTMRAIKSLLVLATGMLAGTYLLNIGAGVVEFLPDNLPIAGNLDEAVATLLLINCLAYFGIDLRRAVRRPPNSTPQNRID